MVPTFCVAADPGNASAGDDLPLADNTGEAGGEPNSDDESSTSAPFVMVEEESSEDSGA